MKILGQHPDYQEKSRYFPYRYVCSLSELVRESVKLTNFDMRKVVEPIVKDFENRPDLVRSLRDLPPPPNSTSWRQVDIRPSPDGLVVFKCFVGWNRENRCWHVIVEGAEENLFESGDFKNW